MLLSWILSFYKYRALTRHHIIYKWSGVLFLIHVINNFFISVYSALFDAIKWGLVEKYLQLLTNVSNVKPHKHVWQSDNILILMITIHIYFLQLVGVSLHIVWILYAFINNNYSQIQLIITILYWADEVVPSKQCTQE